MYANHPGTSPYNKTVIIQLIKGIIMPLHKLSAIEKAFATREAKFILFGK